MEILLWIRVWHSRSLSKHWTCCKIYNLCELSGQHMIMARDVMLFINLFEWFLKATQSSDHQKYVCLIWKNANGYIFVLNISTGFQSDYSERWYLKQGTGIICISFVLVTKSTSNKLRQACHIFIQYENSYILAWNYMNGHNATQKQKITSSHISIYASSSRPTLVIKLLSPL